MKAISNCISVALDLFRLFVYPQELTHHELHDNALVVAYRADVASRVAVQGPMLKIGFLMCHHNAYRCIVQYSINLRCKTMNTIEYKNPLSLAELMDLPIYTMLPLAIIIFSTIGAFIFSSSTMYHSPEQDEGAVSSATNISKCKRVKIIEDESEAPTVRVINRQKKLLIFTRVFNQTIRNELFMLPSLIQWDTLIRHAIIDAVYVRGERKVWAEYHQLNKSKYWIKECSFYADMLSENVNIICQVIYNTLIMALSNKKKSIVNHDVFDILIQIRDPIVFSMITKYSDLCCKVLSSKKREEVVCQTIDRSEVFIRQAQSAARFYDGFHAFFKRPDQHNTSIPSNAPRQFITIS